MKKYKVYIDYPGEVIEVEANSKEDAETKVLEQIGEVTINATKECTAEAEEIE